MSSAYRDLSEPEWTPKLATVLERAAAAIARLDARISVSPVATPWQQRAVWTGYTTALQAQGAEIDEIDIFGRECAVTLPGRPRMPSHLDDHHALRNWQTRLASRKPHHWRDELPISTEVAADWAERPALLRALEIVARHARADSTITPWLTVPWLLKSMNITHATLPCLTIGDKAFPDRDRAMERIRDLAMLSDILPTGFLAWGMAASQSRLPSSSHSGIGQPCSFPARSPTVRERPVYPKPDTHGCALKRRFCPKAR